MIFDSNSISASSLFVGFDYTGGAGYGGYDQNDQNGGFGGFAGGMEGDGDMGGRFFDAHRLYSLVILLNLFYVSF